MAKVFVSRRLPEEVMTELSKLFEVSCNPNDRSLSRAELTQFCQGQDALVSLLSDKIDADFLDSAPSLQIVANYAVGYNNIDIAAAQARKIAVTNTPGVLTETTADTAMALLLAVSRRIVEADEYMRKGKWKGWHPKEFLGKDVWGSTLGIIGMGRIGQALARRAAGFKMKIIYWNRTRLSADLEQKLNLQYCSINEVLANSDFISLHLAYNPETHHLINAEAIAKMKSSAFIVNTARGAVIDEAALVQALATEKIAGAGLDVYENEPRLEVGLATLKNVVLLPHLGSASLKTRCKMGELVIANLKAYFGGQELPNRVG